MRLFRAILLYIIPFLFLALSCSETTAVKDTTKDNKATASANTDPHRNAYYAEGKRIIEDPVFQGYIQELDNVNDLSADEKSELNIHLKPLIRKAISSFRNAHKEMPPEAEVNFELVKWLYYDYIRILRTGTRMEISQTRTIGFNANKNLFIEGYPNMIRFHAAECSKYDHTNLYKSRIDEILRLTGK